MPYKAASSSLALTLATGFALSFDAQAASPNGLPDATIGRAAQGGKPAPVKGTVRLIVTMAWEGRDLTASNLAAVDAMRQRFPAVRVMHFLSPAYFARGAEGAATSAAAIKARVMPGDAVGLRVDGWKSASAGAGVIFRGHPTFWGATLTPAACAVDCGVEVPVNVYPLEDLRKLVAYGTKTLVEQGFERPVAFQTGGFVASPQVREAAAGERYQYDYSPVPPELVVPRTRHYPLAQWVTHLWSDVTPASQPRAVSTSKGRLVEVPHNLAAVDYLDERRALVALETPLKAAENGATVTVVLGMSQETADLLRPMTDRVVRAVVSAVEKRGLTLEYGALPAGAAAPKADALVTTGEPAESATPIGQTSPSPAPPLRGVDGAETPRVH